MKDRGCGLQWASELMGAGLHSMPSCLSLMATRKRSSSSDSSLIRSVMALVKASCRHNNGQRERRHLLSTDLYVCVLVCSPAHLWAVLRCGLHSDDDLVFQGMGDFVAGKQNLRILQQLTDTQRHTRAITITYLVHWLSKHHLLI